MVPMLYKLLMIGVGFIIAVGVPLFVWISYWIKRPTREEEQIHRGVEDARRRIDRFPH